MNDRQGGGQHKVVTRFVNYLDGGEGFTAVWTDLEGIVTEFAGRSLVRLGVKAAYRADDWAMDDVVNQTALVLMQLSTPNARGRFDPLKAGPGLSGLRGWLWRVVETQAVNWIRTHRGGRGLKMYTESCVPFNMLPSGDEGDSLFDRQIAKVEGPDLLPILESCIHQIADAFMRDVLRLKLHEGLSERATAERLRTSVSMVHRRLHEAYPLMAQLLRVRGIDEDWLRSMAA